MKTAPLLALVVSLLSPLPAADIPGREPGSANPILPGYYADPSIVRHEGKFFLYATLDPWGGDTLGCWESPYMFGAGRSPQPFAYWKKFRPEDHRGMVLGGQVCSWSIEEKAEEGLLFGTGPGFPEYGRPAPRVPIMAERVWTGSATTVKDLLERVGANYWK